ncbi:hypothetical protein [Kitasatospora sp. LaBMicrA B282]|uniref:hypothetical protein n=1 Tax=Kitasatospora sp. LaBMicrA B282 TaxID=3420949 RepID=UPI003D0D26DE
MLADLILGGALARGTVVEVPDAGLRLLLAGAGCYPPQCESGLSACVYTSTLMKIRNFSRASSA